MKIYIALAMIIVLSGCKSGSSNTSPLVIPIQQSNNNEPSAAFDFQLLFIGNSHSSANNLPGLVKELILAGDANLAVHTALAPGGNFLAERLDDGVTLDKLTSRSWTHVFLQAQKYSSSGQYFYPTDAAEEWIRRIKAQDGLPIMFPEWPRRDNTEEGQRIHDKHLGIAAREPACVAPVGLAWEESLARYPNLKLHAADGNHSNLTGALLTAYVFYEVVTTKSAAELPYVNSISVSDNIQMQLRRVASDVISLNPPCPDSLLLN